MATAGRAQGSRHPGSRAMHTHLVNTPRSSRLRSMIFLGIILAIFGVAILAVGVLSLAGKLPGNSLVGLRIPEVRKSAEYWVMGHKIAGPAWTGSGLAMLAAAAVAWQARGWAWLIVAGLVMAALFLLGLGAALAAHTLAQIDARAQKAAEAESGCCSAGGSSETTASGEVSADDCASGQACGSCSLNGSCEGGAESAPALDLDAARRAVAAQDIR